MYNKSNKQIIVHYLFLHYKNQSAADKRTELFILQMDQEKY